MSVERGGPSITRCPSCQAGFPTAGLLNSHRRIHLFDTLSPSPTAETRTGEQERR